MTTTTQTILSNVVYGSASGNYDGSSQLFYSDAVPAANYYGGNGSIQTLFYNFTGFMGTVTIEASLNDLADQAQWFDISERGNGDSTPDSGLTASTVTGNFTWLRARVEGFDGGTINYVTVSY
jgi:hypothetical protein